MYSKILQSDPEDYLAEKELRRIKQLPTAGDSGTTGIRSLTNNSNTKMPKRLAARDPPAHRAAIGVVGGAECGAEMRLFVEDDKEMRE